MKDKQCLRTVEKFKTVVKDMLKSSGFNSTVDRTQLLETTSASAADTTQAADETAADTAEEEDAGNDQQEDDMDTAERDDGMLTILRSANRRLILKWS